MGEYGVDKRLSALMLMKADSIYGLAELAVAPELVSGLSALWVQAQEATLQGILVVSNC